MKNLVRLAGLTVATLLFSAPTFAQETQTPQPTQPAAWQVELQNYEAGLPVVGDAGLFVRSGYYISKATLTCSAGALVTSATFVADTAPMTNVLAEGLANLANTDYKTYEEILKWENLAEIGRGALGGGVVGVAESLEFVILWLGGNEELSYKALAKNYESTFATANAMFASQGQCMMSVSKFLLTRKEMIKRSQLPAPLRVPDAQLIQP